MDEKTNKNENIVLYLNMKLFYSLSNEIIHIKNSFIKEFNTFIENKAFIAISNNNKINAYKNHWSLDSKTDKILFSVEINRNQIKLIKPLGNKLELKFDNINKINNLIYRVIYSDDYFYLKEKDIINFGGLNYIVQQININNENNSNNLEDEEFKENKENEDNKENRNIFEYFRNNIENKICDICNKILVKFCKCETYEHLEFINHNLINNLIIEENKKKTVKTYKFKLYRCITCGFICPLKFKFLKNKNIENEMFEFINIKKPNCTFAILEFIGKVNPENENLIDKYIFVVKLNDKEIIIGKGKDGKIIIDDDENLDEAFCALKFDKIDKKLYIKNKNENYYTYIAVKDKLEITEKEIFIKADRVLMKSKIMKKEDL